MSLADSGPFYAVAVPVYLANRLPEDFEHYLVLPLCVPGRGWHQTRGAIEGTHPPGDA
jgi:hypothetical protein